MTKGTRTLSGAAKNAYIDKVVRSALGDDHAARERLARELTRAVASLRVRVEADRQAKAAEGAAVTATETGGEGAAKAEAGRPFDPFEPNVVVVLRTQGRAAALAALGPIGDIRQLRLLAHEQQLGVPAEARTADALREAIVTSAERRVANRRAAGR